MNKYLHAGIVFPFFFFFLIFQSTPTYSQDSASSYSSIAEKIYLQLDNKVYTTDQAIWFKAIVANAAFHAPSDVSAVLYVELIDANENIVERKLIKMEQGIGEGFFQLSPAYSHGMYQVRAYTEWNKNFGHDFFFKDYVLVSGVEKKGLFFDPIKRLTVINGERNERRVSVEVDPSISDSISGKAIQFVVEAKGKKDTLSMKRNRSNRYLLNYLVPEEAELLFLQIAMDNGVNYAKTIVVDTSFIDLQFFPESGELVQGLPAIVGIKAIDYEGKSRKLEGDIFNAKGDRVVAFETNELGMGLVRLGLADTALKFTAGIKSGSASKKIFLLPKIAARGNILLVQKKEDKIFVKASSNYLKDDSIAVRASCRGIIYFDFAGRLKNGTLEFSIQKSLLPEGIINFTFLTNSKSIPVAERLFFNERPQERLKISLSSDKGEYLQREKTELSVQIEDAEGKPSVANISLLAMNEANKNDLNSSWQNILSYFLLSSDLRGKIENPGYYFKTGSDNSADLDMLLLTQGWRKYNYSKEAVAFNHRPESGLTLSGNVKGGLSGNTNIKGAELTMMTFSKPPFFSNVKTDSLGRFNFFIDDAFGDDVNFVIQSANKSNKTKNYLVTTDKKEPPPVIFEHALSVQKPDSIIEAYIKKAIDDKKTEDAYKSSKEGLVLEEVIVKTRVLSPEQQAVTEKYGEPKVIISGKEIEAKEEKWSYGLYSVLLFQFPDKVRITRYPGGMLYASLYNSEMTLVVIDGIPVQVYEYGLIPSIPPSEVKSFELIPLAKGWVSLFCQVFPRACGQPGTPLIGNVIAIYTHAGKGLSGVKPPVGISRMTMPVFAKPREFYAPQYEQLKTEDWEKPDLRNLVHWSPKLTTDSSGKEKISFYNSDNTGPVKVIVEAISKTGEIGYGELLYDVKKRNLGASP